MIIYKILFVYHLLILQFIYMGFLKLIFIVTLPCLIVPVYAFSLKNLPAHSR